MTRFGCGRREGLVGKLFVLLGCQVACAASRPLCLALSPPPTQSEVSSIFEDSPACHSTVTGLSKITPLLLYKCGETKSRARRMGQLVFNLKRLTAHLWPPSLGKEGAPEADNARSCRWRNMPRSAHTPSTHTPSTPGLAGGRPRRHSPIDRILVGQTRGKTKRPIARWIQEVIALALSVVVCR